MPSCLPTIWDSAASPRNLNKTIWQFAPSRGDTVNLNCYRSVRNRIECDRIVVNFTQTPLIIALILLSKEAPLPKVKAARPLIKLD